ncbi:MAG: FAD-binding oxidoreductase [Acidobacteriota bacterium]|nr:FAD-binding oxidoreductase [Acidobacteriota bacterium]
MSVSSENIVARLESVIGAKQVAADAASCEKYAVDGVVPSAVAAPTSARQAAEIVDFAKNEKLSLIPCGHRTKLGIGMPPRRYDLALDVTGLNKIAYYDPADLTLSVDAGIPLANLAAALARDQQFLPLAVPFFEQGTVGGTIASGIHSSLHGSYGSARDFLLGAEFVNGAGTLTKSGGRVVKNVTGYDLHKLLIGSLGTLAVITRLNFRTFPLPQRSGLLVAAFSAVEAVTQFTAMVAKSPSSPGSFEILSPEAAQRVAEVKEDRSSSWFHYGHWHVCISFEGDDTVLHRYSSDLTMHAQRCPTAGHSLLEDDEARKLSARLREQVANVMQSTPFATIFKISTLPTFSADIVRLRELAERHSITSVVFANSSGPLYFVLEPSTLNDETVAALVEISSGVFGYAATHQGQASIMFCPAELKRLVNVWGLSRGDASMMWRVKNAFDPQNIFAPGRFVSGI